MIFMTKKRILLVAAGGAMAALLAAGCSHQDDAPPAQVNTTTNVTPPATLPGASTNTTTTVPGPATTTVRTDTSGTNNTNAGAGGATGSQTGVADAVNKAIHNNAQMTGSRITAVVNTSGEARLTGTAQNTQQKGLAESTASQTPGVSHVINKIEIVATGGAKSAASPSGPSKTKIIVVHDRAAPASDASDQPAPNGPAPASSTGTDTSASSGSAGTSSDTSASPASNTDTKGQ